MERNSEDEIALLNRLLEMLHQAGAEQKGSSNTIVYVAPGAQYVNNLYQQPLLPNLTPGPSPKGEGNIKGGEKEHEQTSGNFEERLRLCIKLLMREKYREEPLFNQQSHWQAVYRILVDKGYCRDSDFDGFDTFIRTVMPEEVNKPYRKDSVKNISQTDFGKPFGQWRFDPETSKTRKPFDRMVAVAQRFKEILEENGL